MTVDLELEFSEPQEKLFFPEGQFPKYTIATKGRRGGLTKGAANAFIEYGLCEEYDFLPKGELFFLWGDTIAANIDKYVERYFLPVLKQLPTSLWKWHKQDRVMKIGRAIIDFRSADRPENWEGFGYHLIFLNEAGIILENDYLYTNAVLPMLIDFPNAKIIAAGAPKGKRHKKGVHRFYQLSLDANKDLVNYRQLSFTGYDNPFIARDQIKLIEQAMDEKTAEQEIYGKFVDITEKKFLYSFDEKKHIIQSYVTNPHLPILISFDFNKDPMTALICQTVDQWTTYAFDEIEMPNGSTPEVCDIILAKYQAWTFNMNITGDATGRNRSALVQGNLNHYRVIKEKLMLHEYNLDGVPKVNLAHSDSRVLCNSVLQNAQLFITQNCIKTINDAHAGNVDEYGELIKDKTNPLHHFDTFRYWIHCVFPDFIRRPEKYRRAA